MSLFNNTSNPSFAGRSGSSGDYTSRVPVPTTRPALKQRTSKVRFPSEQLHNPGPHYASPMAQRATVEGEDNGDIAEGHGQYDHSAPARPASAADYRPNAPASRYNGRGQGSIPENAMGLSDEMPPRPASAAAGSTSNDKFTSLPARVNRPANGGRPITQVYRADEISPMSTVTDLVPSPSTMSDGSYMPPSRMQEPAPVQLAQPVATRLAAPTQLRPPSPAQIVQVVSPRGGLYYRNSLITRGQPIPDAPQEQFDYRSDPPIAPRAYSPPQAEITDRRHGSFPQDARSVNVSVTQPYHNSQPQSGGRHAHLENTPSAQPQSRSNAAPTYMPRPRPDSDATIADQWPHKSSEWAAQAYKKGGDYSEEKNDEYTAAHTRANGSGSAPRAPQRRSTTDLEDGAEHSAPRGGIFSQLLRLGGTGGTLGHRTSSQMSGMSRSSSVDGANFAGMSGLGLTRTDSVVSFGDEMLDPDDPRITGIKNKKARRRMSIGDMFQRNGDEETGSRFNRRRSSVQKNVADILTRHNFILKLARALIQYGAPSHRLEAQLAATARVFEVDAQFVHLPGILIASFGDHDTRTSETHFVKSGSGLMLGKLRDVHTIYREVVHDEIAAGEGCKKLNALFKAPPEYNIYQRLVLAALCSGIVCPLGFGGSFLDAIAAGLLGCTLAFMQMGVAAKNDMFNSIFEIAIATVISFAARGLSQTNYFCYQAVASAGVVLVLPGYTILCGSLELASKNIVSGVSRMVYAILFSLFLGFGITIGSDLFFLVDPAAGRANAAMQALSSTVTSMDGTFDAMNGTTIWSGSFTFTNGTEGAAQTSLQAGNVFCERDPAWAWYRQSVPPIALFALVPAFSMCLSLWNMQPWRSKQLLVMIAISCVGFTCNLFANHYIFNHSDIVSCIGAFVIGILGNLYARMTGGTAFTTMCTGVLVLVPSGIAAAGGLAMTYGGGSDSYSQGLIIGFRMVQVAIGVTVGLLGSGLMVYSFGRKKGSALFAF